MQKTTDGMRRKALRFKRFSRKGYSLFSVLGKEVLIGTLSVAMLSNAKAEGISTNEALADDSLGRKELKLDEVVVTGSRAPLTLSEAAKIVTVITRDDIERAAVESINDVLKLATGVDVRQRGGYGVQTDISVRGGNFDQITILLNGVNISSPHTGHLSADFPVSPDDIERIEIIEGAASRVYGTSAFNGAVNIVTRESNKEEGIRNKVQGLIDVEGGSYGYFGANGRASVATGNVTNTLSAGYSRSDGATDNSAFTSTRLFYQGALKPQNSSFNLNWQAGYSYKPYEANTFYGAASTDQWESNERWMAAVNGTFKLSTFNFQLSTFFNRWYDHYQWHKDSPAGENFHRVESKGASLNAWTDWALGKTLLGIEVRDERIRSTRLGKMMDEAEWTSVGGHDGKDDIYYKYRDQRCNVSMFLEHDVAIGRLTISMGLLANLNDGLDTKWRIYPGVDVKFNIIDVERNALLRKRNGLQPTKTKTKTRKLDLFASWNMALRMPTFTDLYYSGTGIEGNRNLKPEKSNDLQIGAEYVANGIRLKVQGFYSHKTDMIDWVQYMENGEKDNVFHSVNFQMDNIGYELDASLMAREIWGAAFPLRMLSMKYSYIDEKSDYNVHVLASKYAMDYLRHKVILSADGKLWKCLNYALTWRWQDRVGQNLPYAVLDGKLSWDATRYTIYVNATNILNKVYYDYITIKQPRRCFVAGVKWRF